MTTVLTPDIARPNRASSPEMVKAAAPLSANSRR